MKVIGFISMTRPSEMFNHHYVVSADYYVGCTCQLGRIVRIVEKLRASVTIMEYQSLPARVTTLLEMLSCAVQDQFVHLNTVDQSYRVPKV